MNPFIDTTRPLDISEMAKMVLLAPIALLRLFAFMMLGAISMILPEPPYRALINGLLITCGFFNIEVEGVGHLEAVSRGPVIMVGNHMSVIDTFVLSSLVNPIWVAREGQKKVLFFGKYLISIGCVFVQKGCGGGGVQEIASKAQHAYKWGQTVVMFPEGGCSTGKQLLLFKSGAFVPMLPIMPFIIEYDGYRPTWTVDSMVYVLWRLLTQFENKVRVRFLPIMRPQMGETVDGYKERVRAEMGRVGRLPLANVGIDDYKELTKGLGVSWDRRRIVDL